MIHGLDEELRKQLEMRLLDVGAQIEALGPRYEHDTLSSALEGIGEKLEELWQELVSGEEPHRPLVRLSPRSSPIRDLGEEEARDLSATAQEIFQRLNETLSWVRPVLPEPEYLKYRKLLGRASGLISADILLPLWRKYPAIAPDEMRSGE